MFSLLKFIHSVIIVFLLAHIINLSIIQGVVPWKGFPTNDKTMVGNYWPVSISSIISNSVLYQVDACMDQKKISKDLYKFKSGLGSRFSTDTCLIHLTDFYNVQKKTKFIMLAWSYFTSKTHSIL